MTENSSHPNDRRTALKALAAAAGAATLSALPSVWSKPAIRTGAVPAHAQSSFAVTTLSVEMHSESNTNPDYDLVVVDPDNSYAGYDPTAGANTGFQTNSSTMTHGGDQIPAYDGGCDCYAFTEVVTQSAPLQTGTYAVVMGLGAGVGFSSLVFTITLNGVPTVIDATSTITFVMNSSYRYIALVDIPSGAIDTSVMGTLYP